MNNIAIIVPYRDQKGQNRKNELEVFLQYMGKYLDDLKKDKFINDYHIYIIEQESSYEINKKKFNRGLILNIGFKLIHNKYNIIIFHDVDLLPDNNLRKYYSKYPEKPIHIAACWKERYGNNKNYFGGIVSFNRGDFNRINGFPNNFWGWGGEDDALLKRCKKYKINIEKVSNGYLTDIEKDNNGNKLNNIEKKLNNLRENNEWKCVNKWEMLNDDEYSYKYNGIKQLDNKYKMIKFYNVNYYTQIIISI